MPTLHHVKTSAMLLSLILGACAMEQSGTTEANTRATPGSPLSRDRIGVNTHRPTGDDARFLFAKAQNLGLGWVRIDVSWDDIEIAKGEYKWERADAPIREAAARGLRILANLHATPKWANGNRESSVVPTNTEDWQDFCAKVASRYNGNNSGLPRVDIFGIWNEPDGEGLKDVSQTNRRSPAELYADRILKPCSKAIHNSRPDAKTAGPELASESNYLQRLISLAGDSLDIITVHKYSDEPKGVLAHMENIRAIVANAPSTRGKAIWLTETGWSTKATSGCWFGTVDDATQAAKFKGLLALIEGKEWIAKVFFYELRDDDAAGACQWGMLRSDGSEKPWYLALKSYLNSIPQPNPEDHDSSPLPPWGSYRSSCKNEEVKDGILYARCKDRQGNLKNTKLDSYKDCRDIANIDGKLLCRH